MTLFQPDSANARQQLARWRSAGLAGIDEAGRGPLAGPVCAAAVILPADFSQRFAQDSKKLTAQARSAAAEHIQADAVAVGIGWADVAEIDALNILNATFQAMRRALQALQALQTQAGNNAAVDTRINVLVDGNRLPPIGDLCGQAHAVIKGDDRIAEIGAASIIAKVSRDHYMAR
ncbi:MAG: ribonuclease HII, partial [Pseudomonadales bacterium]